MDLYHLFKRFPEQYAIVILNIARDLARRLRALDEKFSATSH
jgi:CRP/FNR family transcriptional regulator, cyclic AMP receptor protein